MKRIFLFVSIVLLVFISGSGAWYISRLYNTGINKIGINTTPPAAAPAIGQSTISKLSLHVPEAMRFAEKNHFNTELCFFVDMSVESGKSRFFVYDMKKKQVRIKGLVAHGRCNKDWLSGRKYGNVVGCGCTSLGRYKIGNPYKGRFGLAYKLYGLDSTNSHAYSRFVVLHAHACVPEQEVDPSPICQSDGCPTVSPGFLQQLAGAIDSSRRPVLLWILP